MTDKTTETAQIKPATPIFGILAAAGTVALTHNGLYFAAFFLKLLLHENLTGNAIYYIFIILTDVVTLYMINKLFGLSNKRNILRGLVCVVYSAINIAVLVALIFAVFPAYDESEAVAELFVYGLLIVPPVLMAISYLTQNLSLGDVFDPERTRIFPLNPTNKVRIAAITAVAVIAAGTAYTFLAVNLSEFDQADNTVVYTDVFKGSDRIYLIDDTGTVYVNGSGRTTANSCAYGFDKPNYYRYRTFLGKTAPIRIRDNVKAVYIFSLGGMFLDKDGGLWYFHGETEGYEYPVKIAENVVCADAKNELVFYVNEHNELYSDRLTDTQEPLLIDTNVVKTEFNTYYLTYLKDDGSLYMASPAILAQGSVPEEPFLTGITEYSSKNAYNFMLFSNESGNVYYVDWSDINSKPRISAEPIQISTSVKSFACGAYISLLIKNDGSLELYSGGNVFGWRDSSKEYINVASDINSASAISVDGMLFSFGENARGQSGYLK